MLAQDRFVCAPSWKPKRSRRYAEGEAQAQARLSEPAPR